MGNTRVDNEIAELITDHYPTRSSAIACRPLFVCRCGVKLETLARWGHHVRDILKDYARGEFGGGHLSIPPLGVPVSAEVTNV